jgi:ion channel-forming bestrophin family protein
MIKYNPKVWFSLIFHSFRGETFKMLIPVVLVIGAITTAIAFIELHYFPDLVGSTITIHSLLGIVLGLFLVFRTNTAYDRWWEGRKLWGAMVNNCRNMAIKFSVLDLSKEEKDHLALNISDYVYAMKEHLRDGVKLEELKNQSDIENADHIPNFISRKVYTFLQKLYSDNRISGEELLMLDKEIKSLTDIIGGCERIKNTPIPYSYSAYMKKFIFVYVLTLPLGIVPQFDYWSIPIVMTVFYFLVSIELIAEEIEDPFGRDANDLPIDELCAKITSNTKSLLS